MKKINKYDAQNTIDKNSIEIIDKKAEDSLFGCLFYSMSLIIIFLLALWLKR